jgi:hypothetical protein
LAALIPSASVLGAASDPAQVRQNIDRELARLTTYGVFDHLAYGLDGPKVTLYGSASTLGLRKDAERAVMRVPGVEVVDNQIESLPASLFDDRLRVRSYLAVYGGSGLDRYLPGGGLSSFEFRHLISDVSRFGVQGASQFRQPHPVHIVVKHQSVTLEGVVGSQFDRQIAEMRVRQLSGVFGVTNRLTVSPSR